MNKCQRCGGENRITHVSAKCSDMYSETTEFKDYDGYVPDWIGDGTGDYIEFTICRHCGQVQGDWPAGKAAPYCFKWGKAS